MIVKLLTEHHLEFLSLKGGCRGSSMSTHVKMTHCWKSHAAAQILSSNHSRSVATFCIIMHSAWSNWFIRIQPRGYKTFYMLNSTEHEIQQSIKAIMLTNCFKSLRCCIYHANKCLNANNCWHFNIYEQDKFCAQLS